MINMTFNNVLFIFSVNLGFVPLPYARTCESFPFELPYYKDISVATCLERCDDYEFAALRVFSDNNNINNNNNNNNNNNIHLF